MPDSKKSKKMNPCWRPFEEACEYARSLGLKSRKQWLQFARGEMPELGQKPDDIPMRPLEAYKLDIMPRNRLISRSTSHQTWHMGE